MYYGSIKKTDIANGTGVRVSLFVSGCTRHCKNCFNQETWSFQYGKPFDEAAKQELLQALSPSFISGLSVLGGEPMEPDNQRALLPLLQQVRMAFPQKTIWCYSGATLDQELLPALFCPGEALPPSHFHCEVTQELLSQIDVLVDGAFIEEQKSLSLKFRGSANQRILLAADSIAAKQLLLSPLNQ